MTEKTVTTTTCDKCDIEIGNNERHINAGSYGRHYHSECFKKMTSLELVKSLGLDEIKHMRQGDWENANKVIGLSDVELGR